MIFIAYLFLLAGMALLLPTRGRVLQENECSPGILRLGILALAGIAIGYLYTKTGATGAKLFIGMLVIGILLIVAEVDALTQTIPNVVHIPLVICGLVYLIEVRGFRAGWLDGLLGMLVIALPLLAISMVIPGAFGGGDIKLVGAWGLLLGWKCNLVAFLIAVLSGGVYCIYLLAFKKKDRKAKFAFGPFLVIGAITALLYGEQIIAWYFDNFFSFYY
ncbi:MAG: A24 family peptidase [bacterium]|nr:A24 family peptidase [bacterium]